jgi:signal transduction protein with GAF and PtsI domain
MTRPISSPLDSTLWNRDELTRLVSGSGNAAETLGNVVALIKARFGTDVCSVYLLEPDRSTLVLAACAPRRWGKSGCD